MLNNGHGLEIQWYHVTGILFLLWIWWFCCHQSYSDRYICLYYPLYFTGGSLFDKIYPVSYLLCHRAWLESNVSEALKKLAACQPVREELVRLQKVLCDMLGIESVVWDCGCNVTHFRGCLLSFQALALHHPDLMHTLQGNWWLMWLQACDYISLKISNAWKI